MKTIQEGITDIETMVSKERLNMSEANREHFDIESLDHLRYLKHYPEEYNNIRRSIEHRIHLHQTRNMYLVPVMLFSIVGESEKEHQERENAARGAFEVPIGCHDTPNTTKSPQRSLFGQIDAKTKDDSNQGRLF